jgi:hypothetical protein
LPPGDFKFDVAFKPILPDGRELTTRPYVIEGTIHSDISVVPRPVLFGNINLKSRASETVAVHWKGDRKFRIEGIKSESKVVECSMPSGELTTRAILTVSCTPTEVGLGSAKVILQVKGEAGEIRHVPFEVRWNGRDTEVAKK